MGKPILSEKPVMSTGSDSCAKWVLNWLSSGHLYVDSTVIQKHGGFKLGTARNALYRLAKQGVITRYGRGLYALDRSTSDKEPRGPSNTSSPRGFAVTTKRLGGVKRVEVWDLLSPEDFAMHDLCFTLREGVKDSAPFLWCEGNGALSFRYNTKNRSFASSAAWNATHCFGRDPLRPVKVNVWRDGFQIIFEARDKPILPTEVMSVVAHLGWVLREIHSSKSFDDLDHYQSHVGRDYLRAMEVSGPAYRMSARDYFDRVLTWYVTSLKQADGSKVEVERHEAVDARRFSAKDWALFRTDPLTALLSAIESLRTGVSDAFKSNNTVLNGVVDAQKSSAEAFSKVTERLEVLEKGGMTLQQALSKLVDVSLVQSSATESLVQRIDVLINRLSVPSLLKRLLMWIRTKM
jgi:acetolactate synthase regulatory subunit